jgi:hypothetical protein
VPSWIRFIALVLTVLASAPLIAQAQAADPGIVVEAQRNADELPVQTRETGRRGTKSVELAAESREFVRCARLPSKPVLRRIVDGEIGKWDSLRALDRYIRLNRGCYVGMAPPPFDFRDMGSCNPQQGSNEFDPQVCREVFDRGAIYEATLEAHSGDAPLTRAQTMDPATLARFTARERPRNALRLKAGRVYFSVVACMVQLSPHEGLRLLAAAPGSDEETSARRFLVGNAQACLGSVTDVQANPAEFRAFTAEAVYAWRVAAAGAKTLVR